MDDIRSTIEAFADGEAVDPGRLDEALASAEGRGYLIDVLVLRGFVAGDGAPSRPAIAPSPARSVWPGRQWWGAAAASVFFSVSVGYFVGRSTTRLPVPSTDSAASVRVAAPEPTRVFKLDESADWTERVQVN